MLKYNFAIFQLENKVSSLEQELAQSIEEKQRLKDEIQLFNSHSQNKSPSINKYSDPTATIEQLSEVRFNLFKW